MTFDESHAKITTELAGRTVDYVGRSGKELEIHTTCGHCIKLQADVNGDIHYKGTSVSILLPGVNIGSVQGMK